MNPFLRTVSILAVVGLLLVGTTLFVVHGIESRGWSPALVSMISLTVANVGLAIWAIGYVREKRRRRREHV